MRIPHINEEIVSRAEIRAGIEGLQGRCDCFVHTTHPGTIQLEGDTASGRAYISELVRLRDGSSQLNYAVYHHQRGRMSTDEWDQELDLAPEQRPQQQAAKPERSGAWRKAPGEGQEGEQR